jgi:ribosome-associated protein
MKLKIEFKLTEDYITLQSLLKTENLVSSGGEAKFVILDGLVMVNSELELRRGKKLRKGDCVLYNGDEINII